MIGRADDAAPWRFRRALKLAAFILSMTPLVLLLVYAFTGAIGGNPVQFIIRYTGDWALRFMLIALAVTPLRRLGWNGIAPLRRMQGLFAFAYTVIHTLAYCGIDQHFDLAVLWRDVTARLYMTVGTASLVMLLPLAASSTDAMARQLGGPRWRRLHQLSYPAAAAGVLHYYLIGRGGFSQPAIYGLVLAVLLALRMTSRARRPLASGTPRPL